MIQPTLIVLIATGAIMTGFAANDMSHGGLAESMGLGHHHMTDYGGYHCVAPDDQLHGQQHVAHMHAEGTGRHCGDAHMQTGGHRGMVARDVMGGRAL